MTDADFEKLGVVMGHRKRLLKAIASLDVTAMARLTLPPVVMPAPLLPAATASAERRHLTVMFCDLVGSTSLSASLDAEDWRDLVGGYLDAASAAVTRMGGHVAKKLGDGIMALLGYPLAQENDSKRALRAALEIFRALNEINARGAGPKLAARIGVETGAVVVDSEGEIFGDAPNLAARVQAAAEPGTVWTTAEVRRQVAGLFVAEDKGAHDLKGVPEPVMLFRIVHASGGGRRSGQRALTPLIGREDELAMLLRRWERARTGEGQFLQIVAEPGLGKSRLIEAFRARLVETPHTWVEWSSSQLLLNTPLHPIADWGRQRFGGADVPAERRLADLEATLASIKLDPAEYAPLLAPLLEIPLPETGVVSLAPEELRRRQMAALHAWVTAGAKAQPLVLAFEDLHWADPTTLDLLKGFAERGALAPLFVVATTRPEFRGAWGARSHHHTITLTPLDRAQVASMVAEIAAKHAFSQGLLDGVTERTGGVPLFVEEVTRLLLERGDQDGAHSIPPTLQQSLSARLDRLGPAREVAMIGEVLGRGFSYPLLRAVAGWEEAPLVQALETLAEADMLLVEGLPPEADYRFKHALVQDAAYENLLKSRRQALHRKAAETLRDAFPARAEAQPEVLAHHFTEGGLVERAIEYWGMAGEMALRRSAFPMAIAHLGKAIEIADRGGGEANTSAHVVCSADQRLKLQTNFGQAVAWSKGFAAVETKTTLIKTKTLLSQSENAAERMKVHHSRWTAHFLGGELELACEAAEELLLEAKQAGISPALVTAERILGLTYLYLGRLEEARKHCVNALELFSSSWDASARYQFGVENGMLAKASLAAINWWLGGVSTSTAKLDETMVDVIASEHAPTIASMNLIRAMHEMARGDIASTLRAATVLLEVVTNNSLQFHLMAAHVFLCWANASVRDSDNLAVFDVRCETAIAGSGAAAGASLFLGRLVELQAKHKSTEQALTTIDRAVDVANGGETRYLDPLLHRIRADILLKLHPADPAPAEQAYLEALAIAHQQGARSFGLQAALKLAKLYQATARPPGPSPRHPRPRPRRFRGDARNAGDRRGAGGAGAELATLDSTPKPCPKNREQISHTPKSDQAEHYSPPQEKKSSAFLRFQPLRLGFRKTPPSSVGAR